VDEILTLSMDKGDALVDASRTRFVESVRGLKLAVMGQTERLVQASTSSLTGMLQRWNMLKLEASDRFANLQADVTNKAATYLDTAKTTVAERTSKLVTEAQPALKNAIVKSHPYVQQACVAGQPYVVQAMEVSQPYVTQAQPLIAPYLAKALEFIENNKLASDLVAQGGQIMTASKSYYDDAVKAVNHTNGTAATNENEKPAAVVANEE